MQIPISSETRAALRVLIAKGVEAIITSGSPEPVREARRTAQRLRITSADGRVFSGVVVIRQNTVTTGLVVEDAPGEDALCLPQGEASTLASIQVASRAPRSA